MDPALAIEVAARSQQKALNDATALGDSEVQKFYNNSVVFLTGGSGFLGKQLIEKLFRSCRISKVFLLLRPKRGKNIDERLEDIFDDPVFDTLREKQPDFRAKVVAVEGDVAEIKLGIHKENWKILTDEVDVMFHVAATTRFDETLRSATLINVRGTREVLLLGKACKKLRSYVHVSTAYSHATTRCISKEVKEEFYEAAIPPETMISMAESMDADRLKGITKEMIKDWPNTYTFTKSLSEELVRTMSTGLPICIVRPGIGLIYSFHRPLVAVICSYREPSPGWLDLSCVFGASGQIVGAGLGILHIYYAKPKNILALVPCDYVNNAIIVAGRETATDQAKGGMDTKIYTVTSTRKNPITQGKLIYILNAKGQSIQTPKALYYVFGYETSIYGIFLIFSFIWHVIPAYIADFVCLIMGKKRMFVKTYKKADHMCKVLSFYQLYDWNFVDDNLDKLYNNLSNRDKIVFNFDVTKVDWTEYIQIWCIGVRKYILKDELKNTDYAIKKQKYLRIVHYIIMILYLYVTLKLLFFVYSILSGFSTNLFK